MNRLFPVLVKLLYAIYINPVPIENSIHHCGLITTTDHFVTNYAEKCFKVASIPVGFSFHNLIALARIPF